LLINFLILMSSELSYIPLLHQYCRAAAFKLENAQELYEKLKADSFFANVKDLEKLDMFNAMSSYYLFPKEGQSNGKDNFLSYILSFINMTLSTSISGDVTRDLEEYFPFFLGFVDQKVFQDKEINIVFLTLYIKVFEIKEANAPDQFEAFLSDTRTDFKRHFIKLIKEYGYNEDKNDDDIISLALSLMLKYFKQDMNQPFIDKYKPIFDELKEKTKNFSEVEPIIKKLIVDDFKGEKPQYIEIEDFSRLSETTTNNEIVQKANQLKININKWNEYVEYAKALPVREAVAEIVLNCLEHIKEGEVVNNVFNLIADFIFILSDLNENSDFMIYLEQKVFEPVMKACDENYKDSALFKPFSKIIKTIFCTLSEQDIMDYGKIYNETIQKWVNYYTEKKEEETVFYMLFPLVIQPKVPYTEEDEAREREEKEKEEREKAAEAKK